MRQAGGAAVARVARGPISGSGLEILSGGGQQDPVVGGVHDVEDARRVQTNAARSPQRSLEGRRAFGGKARRTVAYYGAYAPVGAHLADPIIAAVGDHDAARRVHGHPRRGVQGRGSGRARFQTVAGHACPGQRTDDSGGRNLAHALGSGIRNE